MLRSCAATNAASPGSGASAVTPNGSVAAFVGGAQERQRAAVLLHDGDGVAAPRVRRAVEHAHAARGAGKGDGGNERGRIDAAVIEREAVRRGGPEVVAVEGEIVEGGAELGREDGGDSTLGEGGGNEQETYEDRHTHAHCEKFTG